MEFYETVYARRAIRDFEARTVEPAVIERIIAAGLQAPSNDHLRQWEFVVINDREARRGVIDKVNKSLTEKDARKIINGWGLTHEEQRTMYLDGIPKQYRMLLEAGCLIIPLFRQREPLLKPRNLSALNPFASIWCCIENMLLAAASEGIGGVMRIPFDKEIEHLKETLSVPEDYEIPCYLALGYPREGARFFAPPPLDVQAKIHLDRW